MAGPISAARVAEKGEIAIRGDGRVSAREQTRIRPRDPHEVFSLDDSLMKPGMDYAWVAPQIMGQPNRRFSDYLQAGWTLAEAQEFPEHSGLNVARDPRLVEMGYLRKVDPNGPVEQKGMLLLTRPIQLSRESRAEEQREADRQIGDHMNRLRHSSERAIGSKTQLSRRVTRGAPPPDMVPEDAEIEE